MKRRLLLVTSCCLALLTVPAGVAQGAVDIGSTCQANIDGAGPVVSRGHVAPARGVVTAWGINIDPTWGPSSATLQYLLILNSGGPNLWNIVAVSKLAYVTGSISNPTRLPIAAGQTIGAYGRETSFSCSTPSTGLDFEYGGIPFGNVVTPGKAFKTQTTGGQTAAIWARIEPDADGDGYGDETQDLCPAMARYFQIACPLPTVKPHVRLYRTRAVLSFNLNVDTRVQVKGSVKLPSHGRTVKVRRYGAFAQGSKRHLSLRFPKRLTRALASLGSARSLTLKLTVVGTARHQVSTERLKIKLTGRRR